MKLNSKAISKVIFYGVLGIIFLIVFLMVVNHYSSDKSDNSVTENTPLSTESSTIISNPKVSNQQIEKDPEIEAYEKRQQKYAYEKRFEPHIGVDGLLAIRLENGEAECLCEQAVVWLKSLKGTNYLLYLDVSDKENGFFIVELKSPVQMDRFVPLLKTDVVIKDGLDRQKASWSKIKTFCQKNLKKEENTSLVKAIEEYFKKNGFKEA